MYKVTGSNPVEVLTMSGLYILNCIAFINARIIAALISHLQFNIWNISYYNLFIPHGLHRTHKSLTPNVSGFIAQLVTASHRYWSWVRTLVKSRLFAGFYIRKSINCFHNCDNCLLDFTSAVPYWKYFTYNLKFIPHGLVRTHKWPAPNVSGFIA